MKKKSRFLLNKTKTKGGFTLPELLITLVIAGIITSSLLGAIVQIFEHDKRERVLSETQKDTQMALNYIAEDLRQSIFIYANNEDISPYLPNFGSKPILVFWKLKQLYNSGEPLARANDNTLPANCSIFTTTSKQNECRVLQQKRFAPSLVVYYQSTTPDPRYKGLSRILRYELPRYRNPQTLVASTGSVDPITNNNFVSWPRNSGGQNLQTATPTLSENPPQVLVDFIDSPTANAPANALTCPSADYVRLPAPPDDVNYKSFYTCVRRPITDNNLTDVGVNQDVFIYLRGNAENRGGVIREDKILNADYNSAARTPIQQIRVTLRGIVDKFK